MPSVYKRRSAFEGMTGPDARRAQAALNNYRRSVDTWQAQAEDFPNYDAMGEVVLWDYLGYEDEELAGYRDYASFKASIDARRSLIKQKVAAQRQRHIARERKTAANVRAAVKTTTGVSIRGRPHLPLLYEGQYVYLAVAYNHGQGAAFQGYRAAHGKEPFDPTDITEWTVV